MLPIVLADNNAEYTGRKQALPAIIHLATIISLQYLLCHVMQFCIQTTKSCEEEEHRTLAGGGTESGEEESAERSLACCFEIQTMAIRRFVITEKVESSYYLQRLFSIVS